MCAIKYVVLILASFFIGQVSWAQNSAPPPQEHLVWVESGPRIWIAEARGITTLATFVEGGVLFTSIAKCSQDSVARKSSTSWVANSKTTFFGVNCSGDFWEKVVNEPVGKKLVDGLPEPLRAHFKLTHMK